LKFYEKFYILSHSSDERVLISLGKCYWQEEKNLQKAQQYFHLSLEKNPGKKESFNAYIRFHRETGLFPDPMLLLKVPHFF